ncbi:hypothetical protein HDV02_005023 [Globomyces sp. JEL0801]|nr:hypothetical protein HDV02_005023 [Globomyces sp. JEL0801]
MSSDLVWLLTRSNTSYLVKRNGILLSREAGNVTNKQSLKFSGVAADKTVAVTPAAKGVKITLRKAGVAANKVAGSTHSVTLKGNVRQSAKSVKTLLNSYRPDLVSATLARVSKIVASQGPVKAVKAKKKASFSNPPQKLDSLNFDVYGKHTDDDDPFAKRQRLVVAENSKIEYVGSHVTDLNCKYVVGVMSKKTGNIKVHPTTLMKFNTIVKAHKNIESSVIAEKGMLARNQLGQAFGTKKRKQAIKANEINQVNVSALSDVASTIKDSIQDNVTRQPVQEDLQLRSMNDKATFAKDVYHIDHIIPPQCMEVIDVSPLRKMRLLEECESFLQPWGAGSFIKSTLHAALSEKTDKKLLKKAYALVFDFGSSLSKVGYAGEDSPKTVLPSYVGQVNDPSNTKTKVLGINQIYKSRQNMEIISPFDHDGLVNNWEAFENLWDYTYSDVLRVESKDHPLMFANRSWDTKANREKLCELAFEKYDTPGFYLGRSAVLSAFAAGRATALVIDSGASTTSVVPVFDGYVVKKAVQKAPIGGNYVSHQVKQYLRHMNVDLTPQCLIDQRLPVDTAQPPQFQRKDFTGITSSFVDFSIEATLPQSVTIPQLIAASIGACDAELQTILHTNAVLSGGGTLMPGFSDRVFHELQRASPGGRIKIQAAGSASDRKFGPWIGGSILASLGSFHQLWISKSQYEEIGSGVEKRIH